MELTAERRAALLAYCRLDTLDDGELALLDGLYAAALGYMENVGVREPAEGTPRRAQFELCVNHLTLDAYERRDVTIAGTIVSENPAFRRLMNQLKLTEPVSKLDTGGRTGGL